MGRGGQRDVQEDDGTVVTRVKNGVDRDSGRPTTDVGIYNRETGAKDHVVINDQGDVVHDTTGTA